MKFYSINVYLVFLVFAIISFSSTDHVAFASVGTIKEEDEEEESVDVSPECAVVLITAGSVGGGLASYVLVAPLLSLIGFAGAGVTKGSFAAWWQSTMPNVMAGSIFSSLQSITMGGVPSVIIISSSIGGAATVASHLRHVCGIIDDVDPKSTEGKIIYSLLVAEGKLRTTWEHQVKPNLEAGINDVKDTASVAKEKIGTTWEQHVKPNLPSEETQEKWRSNVKDTKDAFSDTWNAFRKGFVEGWNGE
jgi:hypothetical protein